MPRRLTVLVVIVSLALVAGCGGSDTKKPNTNSSSSARAPVSKAEFESRFVAGLRPAQDAGSMVSSKSDPSAFDGVGAIYQKAYNDISSIVPPKEVADLHAQVVAAVQRLAQDANGAATALRTDDSAAYTVSLDDLRAQGVTLQDLGKQLTERGY